MFDDSKIHFCARPHIGDDLYPCGKNVVSHSEQTHQYYTVLKMYTCFIFPI